MKIFKIYYDDVKTRHLNYDDMNFDGQRNMGIKNTGVIADSLTLHDAYFRIRTVFFFFFFFLRFQAQCMQVKYTKEISQTQSHTMENQLEVVALV